MPTKAYSVNPAKLDKYEKNFMPEDALAREAATMGQECKLVHGHKMVIDEIEVLTIVYRCANVVPLGAQTETMHTIRFAVYIGSVCSTSGIVETRFEKRKRKG